MLRWFSDLFLIREIKSRLGDTYFKRWSIVSTQWGSLYLHEIARSDEDIHMHDHPWDFWSLILIGGYIEYFLAKGKSTKILKHTSGCILKRKSKDFHRIKLLDPEQSTWTLVWVGPRINDPWGYYTLGGWIDNREYRRLKREGYWNE
jgi:hypothetical protein